MGGLHKAIQEKKRLSEFKRIYLASPHMGGMETEFIKEAFDTNFIAPVGSNVDGFEREISDLVGIKDGVALTSGTAAIHMALKYLGVGKGDTVFCSALTFIGSCNPILYLGAEPVFIDSERETWNMSPVALEKAFRDYLRRGIIPKAVVVVDLYGQSADMDRIKSICDIYGVPIVEDAAEALGTTYKGKYSGTLGTIGVYSFNGNKIITTSGGGMLVSEDEEAIKKVKFWATQAKEPERYYQHIEIGYNYRLSNVLAGIGRGQVRVLRERIRQKKNIFDTYRRELAHIQDIEFMPIADFGEPNYWLTVITLKDGCGVKPDDVINALEAGNIESRPAWKPMNQQPVFERCRYYSHNSDGSMVADDIFNRGLCLPSDTKMTREDLKRISGVIKSLWL
ncbi:MAG: DegT/DnrJ/EryC1/StrS family aminotransferase [Clostridiaceae bacterium]